MPSYRQSPQDRFENPPDHAPTRVGVDGGSGPLHTLSVVRVFRRVEHFGQARLRSVIEFILCAAFRRRPWIAGFQPFCLSMKMVSVPPYRPVRRRSGSGGHRRRPRPAVPNGRAWRSGGTRFFIVRCGRPIPPCVCRWRAANALHSLVLKPTDRIARAAGCTVAAGSRPGFKSVQQGLTSDRSDGGAAGQVGQFEERLPQAVQFDAERLGKVWDPQAVRRQQTPRARLVR